MTQPATAISTKRKRPRGEDGPRFQVMPGPKGRNGRSATAIVHDTARNWLDVAWLGANGHRSAEEAAAKVCADLNLREERDAALWRRDPAAYEESLGERPLQAGQKDE